MTASWDDIRQGLAAAPEVAQSPTLTASLIQSATTANPLVAAATPMTTSDTAQTLAGIVQNQAAEQVVQKHKSGGMFGFLSSAINHVRTGVWDHVPGHDIADTVVGKPLATVAQWANYPLSQVQHTYRYYHDVVVHHGIAAGLTTYFENTAAAGGTPIGAIAMPAAQNAAAHVTGNPAPTGPLAYYQDSWDRSATAKVSPGRDLAGLFQLKPGSLPYTAVSGTGDAAFDVTMDPLMRAGTISKALTGSARAIVTANDLERIAQGSKLNPIYTPVHRALQDIADTPSTARINANYPQLKWLEGGKVTAEDGTKVQLPHLSQQLATADTYDKVVDVFRNHLATGEFIGYAGTPTFSLTRVPFRALNDRMLSWQQPKGLLDDVVSNPDIARRSTGALASLKDRTANAVNQFVNHTPFAKNAKGDDFQGATVDPRSPEAANVLYRVLQYGQSEPVARDVADQFSAAPTIAAKAQIWNKGIISLANAAGIPDDAGFRRKFMADLDGLADVNGHGANTIYGMDKLGNDLSPVIAQDGVRVNAPLFTTQGGRFHIPPLADFNTAARSTRTLGKLYGPMDDFVYDHITVPFKRFSLFDGGFPIRAALSEMMTRLIGSDGVSVVHSGITAAAAKIGTKLLPGQAADVAAQMVSHADPGLVRKLVDDPGHLDTSAQIILRHNGTMRIPPAVAAGHSSLQAGGDTTSDLADNVARNVFPASKGARYDPERWVAYTKGNGIQDLSNAVSAHASLIAGDEGARIQARAYRDALAAGHTEDEALQDGTTAGVDWLTGTQAGRDAQALIKRTNLASKDGADPLIDWAGKRMAAIQGVTTNKDGQTIQQLLDGIAESDGSGVHVNLQPDNVKKLGLDNLPANGVPGMDIKPMTIQSSTSRLVEAGYSHVITPIIQWMARNPIYVQHVTQELKIARSIPGLTEDEAWHMAESRAMERMIPEIHNPLDRSQFAQSVRNLIPFYFAREQAARRMATALKQNPFGWRQLQLAVHGMKDAGFIHTDPQSGDMYFNYPLSGELGKFLPMALSKMGINTAVGIPSGFRGDITGFAPGGDVPGTGNTSVGWSPLATFGLKNVSSLFPEMVQEGIAKSIGPIGMNEAAWQMFVPNTPVRNAITAYAGDHSRAFIGSMIDAMQYQMAHGNMPPTNAQPGDPGWQKWIDGIRTQTRTMFAVRAAMGIGSPTSPILENGAPEMTTEYQDYLTKYGLADGTQKFLTKYPNAGAYTVFKTEGAGGVNVPETHLALDWTKANRSFVTKYGEAGSLFIPQTSEPDPAALAVYQQELASGLRHQKSPDEFAQQVMVQQGWNTYEHNKTILDNYLKGVTDPTAISTANTNFHNYVATQLGPSAPLWYADYNNNTARNAQKKIIIGQLQDIFAKNQAPDSPMTPLIQGLLRNYHTYQTALASSAYTTESKTTMRDSWDAWLAQEIAEDPRLTTIVNRVFKGA